jgi:2-(1,2-epoxy-1,2-dihydrophenyl)acetyl-CoA isomerase
MSRVTLEIAGDVATIRLTRADALNAIDPAWVSDLLSAVRGAAGSRAILVLADGPSFTVGGDLGHFTENGDRLSDALHEMIEPFHVALDELAKTPAPVVCAAQGAAAGGGLGLLYAADVVIAGDDLKVATGFARLALTGDGGWSYYLPRLVGMRRAQELALEGRVLDAAEALEWGLVTRVLPVAEIEAEARRVAERFAAGPTLALAGMRRLLRESWGATVREQLTAELDTITATGETADAREGVTAFVQRRAPRFEGS